MRLYFINTILPTLVKKTIRNNTVYDKKYFSDILLFIMPTRFVSAHIKVKQIIYKPININSLLRFYIKLTLIFFKEERRLLKTKIKRINSKHKATLYYLPNKKWKDYIEALTFELNTNYFILTNSRIFNTEHDNSFSIDDDRLEGQVIYNIKLYFSFIFYSIGFLFSKDKVELSRLLALQRMYIKFFKESFIINKIITNNHYNNYVSLLTNSDTHRIIELMFGDSFENTFGILIGPYTECKEISYILSRNIYYQTENERKLLLDFNINKHCKLLKGGVIIHPEKNKYRESTAINKILFIDTCENVNPESDLIWEKNLHFIYNTLINNFSKTILNHKFHPGLNKTLKAKGISYLQKHNINIITELTDYISFDLIISYKSTVLQHFMASATPIILLEGDFNLFPKVLKKDPFTDAPMIKAKNFKSFSYHINSIKENSLNINQKANELFNWFKGEYNYPNGILNIIERISN